MVVVAADEVAVALTLYSGATPDTWTTNTSEVASAAEVLAEVASVAVALAVVGKTFKQEK